MTSGCLRGLIRKEDSDPKKLFSQAVQAGTNGSGTERGFFQAVNALSGTCLDAPWVREDSAIAVLLVSDEDNCSFQGDDCQYEPDRKSSYLMDYLSSIRKPGIDARVYGLLWHPSVPQKNCYTAYHQAVAYAEAIEQSHGTWGSICDADYTPTLQTISIDMSSMLGIGG